jgi:50S ribosomal protein uL30
MSQGKEYLAVVKIRSAISADAKIKGILDTLKLRKKLAMAVFKNTPDMQGQLMQIKDYVAYGEIDEAFFEKIIEKRGKEFKGRLTDSKQKVEYKSFFKFKGKLYKSHFHLHPPIGGFERKGIKHGFSQGGALGNRKEKIAELLERML